MKIDFRRAAIASVCLLAVAALILTRACHSKADPQPEAIRFGMEKDIVTLDPASLSDPATFRVVGQIYESLLTLDEKNAAVPALAESWRPNEAMDVWTFKIRKGVHFHESPVFGAAKTRELTPADVVYSISRSVSPGKVAGFALGGVIAGAGDYMAGKAATVSGLRVVNGDEVEITLTAPEPFFAYRLTSPYIAIYPKEAVDQGEELFAKSKPVGTGPYRVISASDTEITLAKNEHYWGGMSATAPASVSFVVVGNEQVRQAELRNRKLDVAAATPGMLPSVLERPGSPGALPALAAGWADKFRLYSHADFNSYFIAFNTEKTPRRVRRAVNLGVDRTEIAKALTFGTGIPKWNTVPEGLQGYQPPFSLPAPDPAAAKHAMAEAGGLPDGKGAGFELLVHELDSSETLGELLQARMKAVGVEVRITKVTFNEAMRRLVAGEFEAIAMKFQYVFSAPEPVLGMLFSSRQIPGANVWLYRSPEVDVLLARYAKARDREQMNEVSHLIEKQVYEDAPGVFLYQAQSLFLYNPALGNFSVNGHGIPLLYKSSFSRP